MRVINGSDVDVEGEWTSKRNPGKRFEVDRVLVVGHVVTNDDGDPIEGDTLTSVELELFSAEWEPVRRRLVPGSGLADGSDASGGTHP